MREFNDQPPNVETALQYASHRAWAVLPMHHDFYTCAGVHISTRDPNIINQWEWAESFGIAMACGEPSRTDVLEIDDAEAFAAAGFDLNALVSSTLAARTPLGWLNLFFEFAGLSSRSYLFGEWSSTRRAVLLPPAPGRKWLNDRTPQPAPPELIDFLLTHPSDD